MPLSSFLPLGNKAAGKTPGRTQAKDTSSSPEQREKQANSEHRQSSPVDMQDKDDEWCDTSASSEAPTPVKKTEKKRGDANKLRSVSITVKKISMEEEVKLLPYMPALFCTDLPPCGAEVQVAFEIVNAKLRDRWLNGRGQLSQLEVCEAVHNELRQQNYMWPPHSVKGKFKRRKPWCRESVFMRQLQWIEYYLREAKQQQPELLTESELMDRKKESSIPPELKFNNLERGDVLKLWDAWNEKKRAKTLAMPADANVGEEQPDSDVGIIQDANMKQEANAETKDVISLASVPTDSSEETTTSDRTDNTGDGQTVTPTPARKDGDGPEDAHLWSQGGHD